MINTLPTGWKIASTRKVCIVSYLFFWTFCSFILRAVAFQTPCICRMPGHFGWVGTPVLCQGHCQDLLYKSRPRGLPMMILARIETLSVSDDAWEQLGYGVNETSVIKHPYPLRIIDPVCKFQDRYCILRHPVHVQKSTRRLLLVQVLRKGRLKTQNEYAGINIMILT